MNRRSAAFKRKSDMAGQDAAGQDAAGRDGNADTAPGSFSVRKYPKGVWGTGPPPAPTGNVTQGPLMPGAGPQRQIVIHHVVDEQAQQLRAACYPGFAVDRRGLCLDGAFGGGAQLGDILG